MLIPTNKIKIEKKESTTKRFRRDLGKINELTESIKKFGLIQPLVVDRIDDPKYDYLLIAGERRWTACLMAGLKEVDVVLRETLDDEERKELELEENIQRKDLDWMEQVEAIRQLDNLKKKKHGAKQPGPGMEEGTAKSIGASIGTVSMDIKLAKNLADNPELRKKVKSLPKAAARKVVTNELKARKLKALVDSGGLQLSVDLRHGPCEQLIKSLPDDSVECLITDPPFGLDTIASVGATGKMSYNLDSANVSDYDTMLRVYQELLPELKRILVPGAHVYVFLGMGWYARLIKMMRATGFEMDDMPLIWHKGTVSMMAKDYHYIPSYEGILFGHNKPRSRIVKKPRPNVFTNFPCDAPQKRVHSLQKPLDLLKMLIDNSTSPGETVLDCFAGSGSTLKAAQEISRKAIGFELDEGNYLRAREYIGA
jgi:site-specific DNA-methyltransferase (adenine-specific)/modification methylase